MSGARSAHGSQSRAAMRRASSHGWETAKANWPTMTKAMRPKMSRLRSQLLAKDQRVVKRREFKWILVRDRCRKAWAAEGRALGSATASVAVSGASPETSVRGQTYLSKKRRPPTRRFVYSNQADVRCFRRGAGNSDRGG